MLPNGLRFSRTQSSVSCEHVLSVHAWLAATLLARNDKDTPFLFRLIEGCLQVLNPGKVSVLPASIMQEIAHLFHLKGGVEDDLFKALIQSVGQANKSAYSCPRLIARPIIHAVSDDQRIFVAFININVVPTSQPAACVEVKDKVPITDGGGALKTSVQCLFVLEMIERVIICIAYYVIVLRSAPNGSRFSRRKANRVFRVKAPGHRLLRDDRQVQRSRERRVVRHPHPAQTQ